MTLTSTEVEPTPPVPPEQASPDEPTVARPRGWRTDALVAAGYLLGAAYVMAHLLIDPVPGLSVPYGPLTALIGPARTFAVAVALCLAGTAYAWYHVLSRHLLRHRAAAILGGALGGFAPAMIAHAQGGLAQGELAQGELARVAQFLVPFLIWRAVRLREPGRALSNGVILGLLVACQAFLDEELLLLLALGGLIFLVVYAAIRAPRLQPNRAPVRGSGLAFLRGLGVAAIVAAILVAYPMWIQVSGGPDHVVPRADRAGVDLFSYVAFPTPSLATWPVGSLHHARRVTEQNTFYGWPLLILLVGSVWWVRGGTVRAIAATAGVLGVLSLGRDVTLSGKPTHLPAPWRWIGELPLLRSVPAVDVALVVLPLVVLLFALFADWGVAVIRREADRFTTLAWYGLLVAALLPIAPTPVDAPAPPQFRAPAGWHGESR